MSVLRVVFVRPVSGARSAVSAWARCEAGRFATIAWPSAQACHGIAAPTSRICTVLSGRNTWCSTMTRLPDSVATQTASPACWASDSAQRSDLARSSEPSR